MKLLNIINIAPVLALLSLGIILVGCENNQEQPEQITSMADYNAYLKLTHNEVLQRTKEDYNFWEKKHEKEPSQFPYLVKVAASQSKLFNETGKIEYLIEAEKNLIRANNKTAYKNTAYLQSLAHNYISQHKFKQALNVLKKAEHIGENLEATEKMLFDVYMELGAFEKAKSYLDTFNDFNDFDYLIRLAKWSDHRGDLESAIKYMEQAEIIGLASNIASLKQWVYTNLADYYGHDGQINKSYGYYLKALEIDPNDAYAKKGIAWIVYSHEKNPNEALRILDHITEHYKSPDYYLLKSEIAEYKGDNEMKLYYTNLYKKAVSNTAYGDMYNKHSTLLFANEKHETAKALELAYTEIKNRPTPESYDLLAWTHFKEGKITDALYIMETHVVGKTFEPQALFHLAKIYLANGEHEKAKALKKELVESTFELGPLMARSIESI